MYYYKLRIENVVIKQNYAKGCGGTKEVIKFVLIVLIFSPVFFGNTIFKRL